MIPSWTRAYCHKCKALKPIVIINKSRNHFGFSTAGAVAFNVTYACGHQGDDEERIVVSHERLARLTKLLALTRLLAWAS